MSVTVGHIPAVIDLIIYAGDDFAFMIDVQDADGAPVDLTGSTAAAQIRQSPAAPDILVEFEATVAGSTVTLRLPHTDTDNLPTDPAVWDVQVTRPDGTVLTLATGAVRVHGDVTRPVAAAGVWLS